MTDTDDEVVNFLTKTVKLKPERAKYIAGQLLAQDVDSLVLLEAKAKNGKLEPILKNLKIDDDYVTMILQHLKKPDPNSTANTNALSPEAQARKAAVDAAIKAANDYKAKLANDASTNLESVKAGLGNVLKDLLPPSNWNVPVSSSAELQNTIDQILLQLSSLNDPSTTIGEYSSDAELLNAVSEGALRKATIFLPGALFATKAPQLLFKHLDTAVLTLVSTSHSHDETFSNSEVKASYLNDLQKHGNSTSFSVEAGAFFGVGAVAMSASHSSATNTESNSRVNTRSESHQAYSIKSFCVHKAEFRVDPTQVILDIDAVDHITNLETAKIFLTTHGTHIVITPQTLGGTRSLVCTASFDSSVDEKTYTKVLNEISNWAVSVHGWGVTSSGAGAISAGSAGSSSTTSGTGSGNSSQISTKSTMAEVQCLGPSCGDNNSFSKALEGTRSKSWHFVRNGLDFSPSGKGNVISCLYPVWELLAAKGQTQKATLVRDAWLTLVIETYSSAIIDLTTFFSSLVERTLQQKLPTDEEGWNKPWVNRISIIRSPQTITPGNNSPSYTAWNEGIGSHLRFLDRHTVSASSGALMGFHLETRDKQVRYEYHFGTLTYQQQECVITDVQKHWTNWEEGGDADCQYLDRQKVLVESGRVLTGFRLEAGDRNRIRYTFTSAVFASGNLKLTYDKKSAHERRTPANFGADKPISYLDRHNVGAGNTTQFVVGFHLRRQGNDDIYYTYWVVDARDFVAKKG